MSDLDALRAQRLAQLQAGGGGGSSRGGSGGGGGGGDPAEEAQRAQEEAQRRQQEEEMRRGMMSQVLEPEARERLSRISLTRPSLARQIEDLLMRMARAGQIRDKVPDEELKRLLTQVSNQSQPGGGVPKAGAAAAGGRGKVIGAGITIQRKRDDSDSDEYDL